VFRRSALSKRTTPARRRRLGRPRRYRSLWYIRIARGANTAVIAWAGRKPVITPSVTTIVAASE